MKNLKRYFHFIAFLVGILFFSFLLKAFGASSFKALGPHLRAGWPVFFFYPLMCFWDVCAWAVLLKGKLSGAARRFELFWIRLAGEAVNNVSPFLDVGGEPLKIYLLSNRLGVPSSGAIAATVLAKTSLWIAEAVFLVAGVAVFFWMQAPSLQLALGLSAGVLAVLAVFGAVLVFQRKGFFAALSPEIEAFHADEKLRFAAAVLLGVMGWCAGAVEMYWICRLVGMEVTPLQAFMFESLLQLVRTCSFFVPANLGTQEAGMVFLVGLFGHAPAMGVEISLLKRFRQILWTAAGFVVWGVYQLMEARRHVMDPALHAAKLSLDTPLDCLIHRPPARFLATALSRTPVTPNQLTLLSLVPAFLSGWLFSKGLWSQAVWGILFFYFWAVLDHADGELARLKSLTSAFGKKLDDACDLIASNAVLLGIFLGILPFWNGHDRRIFVAVFVSGLVMNGLSGMLVLRSKRKARREALGQGRMTRFFLVTQKALDHLTGREPFYFLQLVTLAALLGRDALWFSVDMTCLLAGLFFISGVSFGAYLKLKDPFRAPG